MRKLTSSSLKSLVSCESQLCHLKNGSNDGYLLLRLFCILFEGFKAHVMIPVTGKTQVMSSR